VVLSPLTFSACKFYPTCSRYAVEAITRHGARRGLGLAAARLWRCRPGTPGGFDPVPEADDEVHTQGANAVRTPVGCSHEASDEVSR
jgi:hypothetical protein